MSTAPVPAEPLDARGRARVLEQAGLLQLTREERFDRIVRLAARLVGVPMAMINLVGDQQWTKAAHGISATVTPLGETVCRHAVEAGSALEVEDLSNDDRFRDNPSVWADPHLRFYAAETLEVRGETVGTLCVLDTRPRRLDADQLGVLRELAAWAETELNNTALNDLARAAHEREVLTRAILDSAGDGIVGNDPDGVIYFVNPAAARLLRWAQHELVGRTLHEVAHHSRPDGSPYPLEECPSHRVIHEGGSLSAHPDVFWRRDGTQMPIEMTVATLGDGAEAAGSVTVFRDVTERSEVQALKDEFIGVVSHELRTPLTSIIGSLRLLEAEVAAPMDERQRPLVAMASSNAQRLKVLVDDILDLERLDSGRMPFDAQPTDAVELAAEVVGQLQGMAQDVGVSLTSDRTATPGPHVRVDRARLVQALTNLVGNACKFTPAGGSVNVRVTVHDEEVRIEVHDTGVGMTPEEIPLIFERFRQVGDASSGRRGTGLGLAITQGIVERSDGRVEVQSAPGVGSVFTIVLPRSRDEEDL